MCDFCKEIKDFMKYGAADVNPYERKNCIVKDSENNKGLWIECDDYYYSGWALDINFCPKCGKKLNDDIA